VTRASILVYVPLGRAASAGVVLALMLAHASDADARKFQMSGSWEMRRGQIFLPLQFLWVPPTPTVMTTVGPSFPNGPLLGMGGVTATGSAPAALRVPRHRFGGEFTAKVALRGSTLVQITTRITPDGPVATATLAPGGGPGSFTWCPGDPDCTAGGPPQGAGSRNGRVIYRAGRNQFGGGMRMLLQGGGSSSFRVNTSPFQVGHFRFGFTTGTADDGLQHTGGPYATTVMDIHPRTLNVVTQPLVAPMPGSPITAPGPTVPGGTSPSCPGTGAGWGCTFTDTHTGFPFTTGTVIAQQSTGSAGAEFFTVMGSDMRTALGAGNITLVAGGLSLRHGAGLPSVTSWASYGRVQMTLSVPTPSLSPPGVAAAAVLVLLAVGYAQRSRPRLLLGRGERRKAD